MGNRNKDRAAKADANQQELVTALSKMATAIEGIAVSIEDKHKERTKNDTKISNSLVSWAKKQFSISQVQSKTLTIISEGFKSAEKLQIKGLAQGFSLSTQLENNSATLDTFSGKMAGFGTVLDVQLSQFTAGITTNSKGLTTLGIFTKATGGNTVALMKAFAKNTAGMRLSSEQQGELGLSIVDLSTRFGVTTQQLVGSIGKLGKQMDVFGALGIGAQGTKAATEISAALGPALGDFGVQLFSKITSGNSLVQSSILGVSDLRKAFLKGNASGIDLLVKESINANKLFKQFSKNSSIDSAFLLTQLESSFGDGFTGLIKVFNTISSRAGGADKIDSYIKGLQRQEEVNKQFLETWSSFKDRVLSPFMELIIKATDVFQGTFSSGLLISITKLIGFFVVLKSMVAGLGLLTSIGGAAGAAGAASSGGIIAGISAAATPLLIFGAVLAGVTLAVMGIAKAVQIAGPGVKDIMGSLSVVNDLNIGKLFLLPLALEALAISLVSLALASIPLLALGGLSGILGAITDFTASPVKVSRTNTQVLRNDSSRQVAQLEILVSRMDKSIELLESIDIHTEDVHDSTQVANAQRNKIVSNSSPRPSEARS